MAVCNCLVFNFKKYTPAVYRSERVKISAQRRATCTLQPVSIPRQLLTDAICALPAVSHDRLTAILDDISVPRAVSPTGEARRTKAQDAAARAALVLDSQVNAVARRFIERVRPEGPTLRTTAFALEEALWKDDGGPVSIPRRFRHELAAELDRQDLPVFLSNDALWQGLEALSLIERSDTLGALFTAHSSPRGLIEQHMIRNDDYGWADFFRIFHADDLSDRRFARLIELLSGPRVRPNLQSQQAFAEAANSALQHCGVELREAGDDGGYPTFALVASGRPASSVKNLIFASTTKPDIVLRDALTNDIEVVSHQDEVLIHDRPIGREGLRWRELQAWWAEWRNISDEKVAKETLYQRLRGCLPTSSPPQRLLFDEYHHWLRSAVPEMPALLPEVWLHYDPLTARQRGFEVLLRQRMDFLLLLPADARVVLEVDGVRHYSDSQGRPSPDEYARMAAGDRDLRLAGYEIYRFGGKELTLADRADSRPRQMLREFFSRLFKRHNLPLPEA